MECTTQRLNGTTIIQVHGRLDATTADQLERECTVWIQRGERHLVLDLADLDYLSSAGLRCLLAITKCLRSNDGDLRVCHLQDMVEEVFTVSGFSTYLPVYRSLAEALAAHASQRAASLAQ